MMFKRMFLFFLMIPLGITGCAFYLVEKYHDKFNNFTRYSMRFNTLGDKFGDVGIIRINPVCIQKNDKVPHYYLEVEYNDLRDHAQWLFIEDGESLICLVDGQRIGFTGKGSSNYRIVGPGGFVIEQATYDVTPQLLEKMANAKTINVKIIGARCFSERFFTQQNLNNFKRFVSEYVTPYQRVTHHGKRDTMSQKTSTIETNKIVQPIEYIIFGQLLSSYPNLKGDKLYWKDTTNGTTHLAVPDLFWQKLSSEEKHHFALELDDRFETDQWVIESGKYEGNGKMIRKVIYSRSELIQTKAP